MTTTFSATVKCPCCGEAVDCDVEAEVSGRDRPMRWGPDGGSPPEYAEADILTVVISATGKDITDAIDTDQFQDEACETAAQDHAAAAEDAAERRAEGARDARRFRED
jgi:hypothetical protein